eukprot:s1898_g3.t1
MNRKRDPWQGVELDYSFRLEEFAEDMEYIVAPHIIRSYLEGDQAALEKHCGDAAFAAVNAGIKEPPSRNERIKLKMSLDTTILAGPREIELKGAKLMEQADLPEGGVTQIFMMSVLFNPMVASGLEPNVAWRVSMVVPAVMFVVCAICMKLMCWDMPTARNYDPAVTGKTQKPSMWDYVEVLRMCWDMPTARNYDPAVTGKTQKPSMWDYVEVLRDVRVVVMIFQYSACFGTELAMNNQLATHFRTYFQMDAGDASALAGAFGLMNLFARSLGGISSDICYKYFGFRGRIWAQFLALFFEAIFLFSFGNVDNSQPWYVALAVLVCFSLFVQMAEGTSYGIVPFMNRKLGSVHGRFLGDSRLPPLH